MDCTFCTKKADNIEVDSTSKKQVWFSTSKNGHLCISNTIYTVNHKRGESFVICQKTWKGDARHSYSTLGYVFSFTVAGK